MFTHPSFVGNIYEDIHSKLSVIPYCSFTQKMQRRSIRNKSINKFYYT